MTNDKLIEARRNYAADTLRSNQLTCNPVTQFTQWLQHARDAKLIDATAMALSTVDKAGQPHSRIVLLKHVDDSGLTFYTNYNSDKGQDLGLNPGACLLFYWRELERQVRIEGMVNKIESTEADNYFQSRPEGSRFSAAASDQSRPVDNRAVLEHRVEDLHKRYPDGKVPKPAHWGGYRLEPNRFEFWQGRSDRLHDRFQYLLTAEQTWAINRLSP